MIYSLGDIEVDLGRVELRRGAAIVPVEPQVFDLIVLLVENHDRMVTRDEVVARVWEGRIVSEAAISSRIKAARRALGDDGTAQRIIKTIHGRGLRCVAEVRLASGPDVTPVAALPEANDKGYAGAIVTPSSMPSIAVLPFVQFGHSGRFAALSEAVPHEIISTLARLRWLRVIARGSSFRFRGDDPDVGVVGSALNVRYCLTGTIEVDGDRLRLGAELADTSDRSIVWADRTEGSVADVQSLRADVTARVASAFEAHVPLNEARHAQLAGPASLDAWGHYHLGVQHLFRFSRADNAMASENFELARRLEPEFARAHAGLSFTRFQNAYLGFADDRAANAREARVLAERAVSLDPLDPFASLTLGRSLWLSGDLKDSIGWLQRARTLSPSYAQAVYSHAWTETLLGKPELGRGSLDVASSLSPLDPFMFAMKGTRALGYVVEGRAQDALPWIDEAARTPGANNVVFMVAAAVHQMNGDGHGARQWVKRARERNPSMDVEDFLRAIPFADRDVRAEVSGALLEAGVK